MSLAAPEAAAGLALAPLLLLGEGDGEGLQLGEGLHCAGEGLGDGVACSGKQPLAVTRSWLNMQGFDFVPQAGCSVSNAQGAVQC